MVVGNGGKTYDDNHDEYCHLDLYDRLDYDHYHSDHVDYNDQYDD